MTMFNPFSLIFISLCFAAVPVVIGVATSYVKVSIVLGLIKNALGTQNTPGTLVVTALSLALTCFIMAPTFEAVYQNCQKLDLKKADFSPKTFTTVIESFAPVKVFLIRHAGMQEQEAFAAIRKKLLHAEQADPGSYAVLIPAFLLSELKRAFQTGFIVLLPFLVIDLVTANILAGLGMYMMSPATIALPLKLLLMVQSNAWLLLAQSLIASYEV